MLIDDTFEAVEKEEHEEEEREEEEDGALENIFEISWLENLFVRLLALTKDEVVEVVAGVGWLGFSFFVVCAGVSSSNPSSSSITIGLLFDCPISKQTFKLLNKLKESEKIQVINS